MDDMMLEQLVGRVAALTVYPPTPALRGRVAAAIAGSSHAPARMRPRFAVVLTTLAAIAIALAAVALAAPSSRSAIADFFGVDGSRIERLPTSAPEVTPTPLPPASDPAAIATPVSLDEAERRVGFVPPSPRDAGPPRAVYVKTYGETDTVAILRFDAYDLWEMRPRDVFLGKGLPEGVVERDTIVGGRPAYWIEGGPHVAYLFDQQGELPGSERTVARDTLIWRTDFALYRMETTLSLADATRLAETLP
jgi:hypothetical protein